MNSCTYWESLYFLPGLHPMLSAYLDESGTHGESPVMCVAGLLYDRKMLRLLDRQWKNALQKAGVGCFHMKEYCHLQGEFQGKDRRSSDELFHKLIEYIKQYACGGVAVATIPEDQFTACVQESGYVWPWSQYTTCAHICMLTLRSIARRLDRSQKIDFNIESGHKKMNELNRFIREVWHSHVPGTHAFRDKRDLRPLQTADVWAYEITKRGKEPYRRMRKSLQILIENNPNMRFLPLGPDRLRMVFAYVTNLMLARQDDAEWLTLQASTEGSN
jgi:hypothetical protein